MPRVQIFSLYGEDDDEQDYIESPEEAALNDAYEASLLSDYWGDDRYDDYEDEQPDDPYYYEGPALYAWENDYAHHSDDDFYT